MQVTHMPPELLTTGHLSKAADSFAWGAILWELFSGERPWPGMLPMQVSHGPRCPLEYDRTRLAVPKRSHLLPSTTSER